MTDNGLLSVGACANLEFPRCLLALDPMCVCCWGAPRLCHVIRFVFADVVECCPDEWQPPPPLQQLLACTQREEGKEEMREGGREGKGKGERGDGDDGIVMKRSSV